MTVMTSINDTVQLYAESLDGWFNSLTKSVMKTIPMYCQDTVTMETSSQFSYYSNSDFI